MTLNLSTYSNERLHQFIDDLKAEISFIEHYENGHFTQGDLARNRTFHEASKDDVHEMLNMALLELEKRSHVHPG